ncbi:MAG: NAD(P)-dependent alcohol dehydrogenase [Nitrospiraceae bacterium]
MRVRAMAAASQGAELSPWSYDSDPLGPFDCTVQVQACGLCHSDLHMIDNDWRISRYPLIPGHEVVGTVVELGPHVAHLKTGDRVGVGWQRSACLQCRDCLRGNENLCVGSQGLISDGYGGFADIVMLDSRFCFRIPERISTEAAGPLLCGGVTVYSALRAAGMGSGQEVGVIGFGGLGHLALQFAAKLGNRVTVFTTSRDKAALAAGLGAQETLMMTEEGSAKTPSRPLDIIISTVPVNLDMNPYLNLLGSDGTLTLVGNPKAGPMLSISLEALLFKRRRVTASPIGGRAAIQDTLEIADRFGISPMVETFRLADANAAIKKVRENRIRFRAVLMT